MHVRLLCLTHTLRLPHFAAADALFINISIVSGTTTALQSAFSGQLATSERLQSIERFLQLKRVPADLAIKIRARCALSAGSTRRAAARRAAPTPDAALEGWTQHLCRQAW